MRISYTLGGKSMTDTLTVAPNGSKFLIFKNWNITTPLVKEISVYASPAITNFTVNGVKVGAKNATASDSGTYTFNVYPGSYTVKPVTSKYLTADSTTLTTSSESSASISAEPTDALADEINAKIKDKLDTCAKSTDAQPEGCPFSMYGSDDDYRNIAWNITEYPTVTTDDLSIDSGSFYVYGGRARWRTSTRTMTTPGSRRTVPPASASADSSRWTATSWTSRWTRTDRNDFARHGAPAARTVP